MPNASAVREPAGTEPSPSEPGAGTLDTRTPETTPEPSGLGVPDAVSSGGNAVDGTGSDAGAPLADAAVAPPEPEPSSPACEGEEALGPDGNCYLAVSTPASWVVARLRCLVRGDGWDLASIRSEETNRFIATLGVDEAWIGASDVQTEGTWIWVGDGTAFWMGDGSTGNALNGAFENWLAGEPNGDEGSACARVISVALGAPLAAPAWADQECSEELAFICEGPAR